MLYWVLNAAAIVAVTVVVGVLSRLAVGEHRQAGDDPTRIKGLADRHHVRRAAGVRGLRGRAATLRPSLTDPAPAEVGYRLGTPRRA